MTRRVLVTLAKISVGLLPSLFLVIVAEAVLRWTGAAERCHVPAQSWFWMCDPVLGFRTSSYFERLGVKINRLGLRGSEPSPKKPGEFQILSLGDSCTFGISPDPNRLVENPYPELLERWASEMLGLDKVRVINGAAPGYSSLQGLLLLRSKLRSLRPDAITVRYGWNDHFVGGNLG